MATEEKEESTFDFEICRDIDEAEYLLDQLGAPDKDEDKLVTKLRNRLSLFLKEIREGAEGMISMITSPMRVCF